MIAASETSALPVTGLLRPLALIGRGATTIITYMGGFGVLSSTTLRELFRGGGGAGSLRPEMARQFEGVIGMGAPLVALVHFALGSTLSMQSYYGGTFVEGTGAVVGVGLIRSMGAVMTGMILSGLLAARNVPELRGLDPADPVGPGRSIAARVVAATVAGPILTLWGAFVGTMVGWSVAGTYVGVTTHEYFGMFAAMLWARDVVGLFVNSLAYAGVAAMISCNEGLRGRGHDAFREHSGLPSAVCRAACFSAAAILVLNSAWFLLAYHAGTAFGPTLLPAPGR